MGQSRDDLTDFFWRAVETAFRFQKTLDDASGKTRRTMIEEQLQPFRAFINAVCRLVPCDKNITFNDGGLFFSGYIHSEKFVSLALSISRGNAAYPVRGPEGDKKNLKVLIEALGDEDCRYRVHAVSINPAHDVPDTATQEDSETFQAMGLDETAETLVRWVADMAPAHALKTEAAVRALQSDILTLKGLMEERKSGPVPMAMRGRVKKGPAPRN